MSNKKFFRAFVTALLSGLLSTPMSASIIGSQSGESWSYPSRSDIVCWQGKDSRRGVPQACLVQMNQAGIVSTTSAGALVPGVDNTNPLGTYTNRWSDMQGVTSFWGGNMGFGTVSSGAVVVQSTTSFTSIGQYVPMILTGTNNASVGSVLIASSTSTNQLGAFVGQAAGASSTAVIGVAQNAATVGGTVNAYFSGYVVALASYTVAVGDILVSTGASAGYLATNNSATANQQVGISLGSCGANQGCSIPILLLK